VTPIEHAAARECPFVGEFSVTYAEKLPTNGELVEGSPTTGATASGACHLTLARSVAMGDN